MQFVTVTEESIPSLAKFIAEDEKDPQEVLSVELTLGFRRDNFIAAGNSHYVIEVETFKKMWANRWADEEAHQQAKSGQS